MDSMTKLVREFHEKHGFDVNTSMPDTPTTTAHLRSLSKSIAARAVTLESMFGVIPDSRLIRAHLLCEELAEAIEGLAERDVVKLADGLGDLSYVTHGTAVAYGIPLDVVEREIHRSNMTKTVRDPSVTDPRLRNKGASYEPPRIKEILDAGR